MRLTTLLEKRERALIAQVFIEEKHPMLYAMLRKYIHDLENRIFATNLKAALNNRR